MMMSGSGASTFAADCGRTAASRLTEVATNTVPAGHRQSGGPDPELTKIALGLLHLPLVERSAVAPAAVQDYGDLPGNGYLCVLHANPPGSP